MTDLPPSDDAPSPEFAGAEAIDTRLVRRLADILHDTGLTTIEVERGDLKIRVAREVTVAAAPTAAPPTHPASANAAAPALREELAAAPAAHTVKSPMVGTIYLQPQPGSPAFVRVGDSVTVGQTLCIIEAMKTMNPIAADKAGVLEGFLVGDGSPVEYGEPLAVIA